MRVLLLGVMLTTGCVVLGCGSTPSEPGPCDATSTCAHEGAPSPCVADPSVGRPDDRCGVFVSSSLGSDGNGGTQKHPVRTLARAIALAEVGPRRVYACAEAFLEVVTLPAGVELWGGLDCVTDWRYLGGEHRTTIAPGAEEIPLVIAGDDGTAVVADVHIEAADAMAPSGSSIAVMVMPGAGLEILRSQVVAGDGAPGAQGEDGGSKPAQAGTPGLSGHDACSADLVAGGASVETVCGNSKSTSGQGGQGTITIGTAGADGQPEPVPNPVGHGRGGIGDTGSGCLSGMNGTMGPIGTPGLGAKGHGRISLLGWEGDNGQDGGDGLPGQGGGGGGGTQGGQFLCGYGIIKGGAGGGSGGGGGCGGKGAKGGGYGGASIGLLSLSPQVTVRATTIITGNGGDGGVGGYPQVGGLGGPGGPGGAPFYAANNGCHGGPGGQGGYGGFGGGGLGGPSLGIAHVLGAPVAQEDLTIQTGQPGKGGLGGTTEIAGSAGEDGVAAEVLAFAPGSS